MIKKFLSWVNSLRLFKNKQESSFSHEIPESVENIEVIVRVIFYPQNVTKDRKTLKANAFRSPSGIDEVSVIRLNHSNEDFCKQHGKNIQNPEQQRAYFGLAKISCSDIRDAKADVISSPLKNNLAHADIKIGYICQKGEELPSEYRLKVDEMAKRAVLFEDLS